MRPRLWFLVIWDRTSRHSISTSSNFKILKRRKSKLYSLIVMLEVVQKLTLYSDTAIIYTSNPPLRTRRHQPHLRHPIPPLLSLTKPRQSTTPYSPSISLHPHLIPRTLNQPYHFSPNMVHVSQHHRPCLSYRPLFLYLN